MHAVQFDRYGPPDVLRTGDRPVPQLARGDVLVRVAAAGVNPADARLRSGQFRFALRLPLPFVPGNDVAGVVQAVGDDVVDLRPGDPVVALTGTTAGGACAELVAVPQEQCAPAPRQIPLGEAASVPLCGSTALQALRDQAGLRPGQALLVLGAGGGVGTLAVQVGRALGASVTAVAAADAHPLLARLGCERVLDRSEVDLRRPPEGLRCSFDVVLDAANGLPFRHGRRLLRPAGTQVSVNPIAARLSPGVLAHLRGGRRLRSVLVRPSGADLRQLVQWLDAGTVRPAVTRSLPLTEVQQAHRDVERGHGRGKTVLVVDEALAALVPSAPAARPA